MKDSLKMAIPNAVKGKREWKSRKLLIGDTQCELGIEWTENILCEATSRVSVCNVCMRECIPRRDGGWNGERLKERVIKASKALMGQRGEKMWRREGETVEKMLRRAKSRSEMLSVEKKKCVSAHVSFSGGKLPSARATLANLSVLLCLWHLVFAHVSLSSWMWMHVYMFTHETAESWRWKPPDDLRQSRCSCQSVSPSHWQTATASESSRFWSSGCCHSLPAWVVVTGSENEGKESKKIKQVWQQKRDNTTYRT